MTGATGFFGTWLLEVFLHANDKLKLGAELVGLSRNPAAYQKAMAVFDETYHRDSDSKLREHALKNKWKIVDFGIKRT